MAIGNDRDYIRELSDEEAREIVDRESQARLGLSGEEFARAYRCGEFDDRLDDPDVRWVAALLAFAE